MKKSNRRPGRKVVFVANGNFAIHVTDLRRAKDFYGGVLGFKLLNRSDELLRYDAGEITLYIVRDEKVIPFIPALEVDDYKRAKRYLAENGCRISKEWPNNRALYFEDPFGLVIDIIEK